MTTPADDVGSYNESALEELAWAIEASQGQFSLFLARSNYTKLRSQLAQRLQQLCAVPMALPNLWG